MNIWFQGMSYHTVSQSIHNCQQYFDKTFLFDGLLAETENTFFISDIKLTLILNNNAVFGSKYKYFFYSFD